MEDADLAELSAHYARGEERDRLSAGQGLLDFTRTAEIIGRFLPAAPALLADLAERLADPVARAVVLDTARAVERVPELLGISPHLLATGICPG